MRVCTTLRSDALALDPAAVPQALVLDAVFAGALTRLRTGELAPAGGSMLPPLLARAARGERGSPAAWIERLRPWARSATEDEMREWYGPRAPTILALHRQTARDAMAAGLAGDGDDAAISLACLCGQPATPRERRRLAVARLSLPLAVREVLAPYCS